MEYNTDADKVMQHAYSDAAVQKWNLQHLAQRPV